MHCRWGLATIFALEARKERRKREIAMPAHEPLHGTNTASALAGSATSF